MNEQQEAPMKIAITCHPTQGGSGIVATELALGLAARGHEVHMISRERPYRLHDGADVAFHKVNTPDYPLFKYPPHTLSLVNKIMDVILEHDLHVIHAHYAVPHAICAILAGNIVKPHPVKIVATMHGTDITLVGNQPEFFRLTRYTIQQCDRVTVVSRWLGDKTMEIFSPECRPEVITNFVDTTRFNSEGRAPYPENGEFMLLHASNFRPVKRTGDIARVFALIRKRLPARMVFVGDGPELEPTLALCQELGVRDSVLATGDVKDIERTFRQAHAFFLLSEFESFGLSALEAMACGTPAIGSNSGGMPEVIEDGVTGLLCEVGDVNCTAERLVGLLADRTRWERMSAQAARAAREKFEVTKIIPQYERLYRRILAE